MTELLVFGAGPTGLMAAFEAVTAGRRCTVIEASDHVGGMAGSFDVAGHRVDYGSHRLHPATPPDLLALIEDLLGSDLQLRPRTGRIRLGDRWIGFPLRMANMMSTLPFGLTARLACDSLGGTFQRALPARQTEMEDQSGWSFHDEVTTRLGSTVAEQFYGPFATKLYGVSPQELSAELAVRRVSAASPTDIAKRLLRAARPTGRAFYYPRQGYGQICERLAEVAADRGATIELGTPVAEVAVGEQCVEVTAGEKEYTAPIALSTMPLPTLASAMKSGPPVFVTDALTQVRTRAMLLVYLVLGQPQYTAYDAHYIPTLETQVARLSEPKNYRDGDDPAGTTVLCAEIPCWVDDDIWTWSDDALAELVAGDLQRVGLPVVSWIECEVARLGSVYPVYERSTEASRIIIDQWIADAGRLVPVGRQGLRVIDNLHHVFAMGQGAVSAIDESGALDGRHWQELLDQFATHTVED